MVAEAGEGAVQALVEVEEEQEEGVVQEEVVGVSDLANFQIGGNSNVSGVFVHIDV